MASTLLPWQQAVAITLYHRAYGNEKMVPTSSCKADILTTILHCSVSLLMETLMPAMDKCDLTSRHVLPNSEKVFKLITC